MIHKQSDLHEGVPQDLLGIARLLFACTAAFVFTAVSAAPIMRGTSLLKSLTKSKVRRVPPFRSSRSQTYHGLCRTMGRLRRRVFQQDIRD